MSSAPSEVKHVPRRSTQEKDRSGKGTRNSNNVNKVISNKQWIPSLRLDVSSFHLKEISQVLTKCNGIPSRSKSSGRQLIKHSDTEHLETSYIKFRGGRIGIHAALQKMMQSMNKKYYTFLKGKECVCVCV